MSTLSSRPFPQLPVRELSMVARTLGPVCPEQGVLWHWGECCKDIVVGVRRLRMTRKKTKAKDSNDNIYCRLNVVFEDTEARGAMRGKCWRRTDHSLGQVLWCSGNHDDDIIEITKKPASCGQILRSPAMSSFIILILITLIIINILMIIRCDQILRRPARSLVPATVSSVSGARGALAKMWECFLFFILLLWLVRFVFFIALVESNGPLESEKSNIKMK